MQKKPLTLSKQGFSYFAFLFKKNIPIMLAFGVVYLLFSGMISPNYFKSLIEQYNPKNLDYISNYSLIAARGMYSFFAPFLGLSALAATLLNFRFLNSRTESDIVFSLPAKRITLFSANFASGLISLIIPFLVLRNPLPIFAFSGNETAERIFAAVNGYSLNMLTELLLLMACYSFSVFLCIHFGKIFDCILNYLLLCVLLPISIFNLLRILSQNMLGISENYYYGYTSGFSSVFLTLPEFINTLINKSITSQRIGITALIYGIFFILFTVLAAFVFQKRKTEGAGSPYAFLYFRAIFTALLSFMFGIFFILLFSNGSLTKTEFYESITIFFIVSILTFFGFSALANRSFNIFDRRLFAYIIVLVLFFSVFSFVATDGFGAVTYVPNTKDVKEVKITVDNQNPNNYCYEGNPSDYFGKNIDVEKLLALGSAYTENFQTSLKATKNSDIIKDITAFHKAFLKHFSKYQYNTQNLTSSVYSKNYSSSETVSYSANGDNRAAIAGNYTTKKSLNSFPLQIEYTLKDGRTVKRLYNSYLSEWLDESYVNIIEKLSDTNSLSDTNIQKALDSILGIKNTSEKGILTYRGPLPNDEETKIFPTVKEIKQIFEAVISDENKMTSKKDFEAKDYCVLGINEPLSSLEKVLNGNHLIIKENYKKTIALLNKMDIKNFKKLKFDNYTYMEFISYQDCSSYYYSAIVNYNEKISYRMFRSSNAYYNEFQQNITNRTIKSHDIEAIESSLQDISLISPVDEDFYFAIYHSNNINQPLVYCFKPSEKTKKLLQLQG